MTSKNIGLILNVKKLTNPNKSQRKIPDITLHLNALIDIML